jgi:hypothetical protein
MRPLLLEAKATQEARHRKTRSLLITVIVILSLTVLWLMVRAHDSGIAQDGSVDPYPGMTCAEIGRSYHANAGDPHDRDQDGIACESS